MQLFLIRIQKITVTYHTSTLREEKEPGNNVEVDVGEEVLQKQLPLIYSPFKGLNLPLIAHFHSEKRKQCSITGAAALSSSINNLPRSLTILSTLKKKVCTTSTGKRPSGKVIQLKDKQSGNKEISGSLKKLLPKNSIFIETMETLIQEQDHAEIRPKRQKQSSHIHSV